ncbi:hypothetical protein C1645_811411 [Glomus cerebriforme]|uniref:Uncharacterized protein n=1 Tax=Glomus cerebriforme TaxID=658196 RepID=A0A397TW56_9GLOM|nr:hypothetical protein C1645_811411 [Glomus cerebriforme]
MDQAEMQFGLDQSLARNEVQVILNKIKLGILSDRGNSKRKATHMGKDSTDALTSSTEKITTTLQNLNAIMKRLKLDEKNILNEEGPINYSQKLLNEGIELKTHKKVKKAMRVALKTNTQKSKNTSETSTRNNNEKSSEQSSSSDLGPEGDEEIKLDFASIEKKLLREQSNEILEKVKTNGLRWCDFQEVLALSSNSLAEFMEGRVTFLSLGDFEIRCSSVPKVSLTKTSEDEHYFKLLHPIIRPSFFTDSCEEYIIQLNYATSGGPDETVLLTNQGDLVESYIMDLKYDGLYRSWPFLTTRLVKDKMTILLMESNIRHMKALEERISKIAENYNAIPEIDKLRVWLVTHLSDVRNDMQQQIKSEQQKQKDFYDKKLKKEIRFKIGDQVLYYRTTLDKQWSEKLSPKWKGLQEQLATPSCNFLNLKMNNYDRILEDLQRNNIITNLNITLQNEDDTPKVIETKTATLTERALCMKLLSSYYQKALLEEVMTIAGARL